MCRAIHTCCVSLVFYVFDMYTEIYEKRCRKLSLILAIGKVTVLLSRRLLVKFLFFFINKFDFENVALSRHV